MKKKIKYYTDHFGGLYRVLYQIDEFDIEIYTIEEVLMKPKNNNQSNTVYYYKDYLLGTMDINKLGFIELDESVSKLLYSWLNLKQFGLMKIVT